MTSDRLSKGFHRLGLILALLFGIAAIFVGFIALGGGGAEPKGATIYVVAVLIVSFAIYGLCRAVAWVAIGFMRS